jgi:predicted nuclease of predicted toxin-antitoxin system
MKDVDLINLGNCLNNMITRLTKHDQHKMRIHLTRGLGPHYAALRCVQCNSHIQWLSQKDVKLLEGELNDKNLYL